MDDPKAPEVKRNLRFKSFEQMVATRAALAERYRQDGKWGDIHNFDRRSPEEWLTILAEEFGELAEGILERDAVNVRKEVTQVAAVALAIHESLQRRSMQERDNDRA